MSNREREREGVCACEVHAAETEISSTYFSLGFFYFCQSTTVLQSLQRRSTFQLSTRNTKEERKARERERERRETVRESFNQFLQQRLPKRRRRRNISVASDVRAKSELLSEKSNHVRSQQSLEWFKKLELASILFKVVM